MKRSTSPITPTVSSATAVRVVAAFAAAVLATLLLLYVPPASAQESTRQMPAGMEVGEGGVSINDGEIFAGDGCAKVGDLEAGDCGEDKAGGKGASGATDGENGSDGSDESGAAEDATGEAGDGPSDEQYGAEDGSGGDEATVLESTTSGGSGGGESTQSQILEATTGVVEEESGGDADSDVDPGAAGGEPQPESTTEEAVPEEAVPEEVVPEGVVSEEGAAGAEDADRGCTVEGPMGETTTTTVEEAADGDTVETPEGTVRLIGVDTPETVDPGEPVEPGGEEASEFTAAELEGEEVELEFGEEPKDDYGRALAYLWVEDEVGEPVMFNETLLREGMGELLIIPPNDEYERCLAAAEEQARAEGIGMWAESAPPETTGETTATDETPPANQEEGQDGILGGLFGGEEPSGSAEDQYADETTAPASPSETDEAETTAPTPEDSSAAEGQYEEEAAVEPAPSAPADEPEVQQPEKQEEEIQEPEIQEGEVQNPPARSSELADAPAELPAEVPAEIAAELPTDDTSVPPSSVPAGAAPITTLPETGGASVLSLVAGTLLVCSGLLAARLARTTRRPGTATASERVQD